MLTVGRVWTREVPEEWETALRRFSPIRTDTPWLAIRWFPMRRRDRAGTWQDTGRWVLYECLPEALVRETDPENDIWRLLSGPQPSRIRDEFRAKAKAMYASDYQCAMYRTHKVWARNLWVLQGSEGGHPVEYNVMEQAILKAHSVPTDPPPLGGLAYAPLDQRVFNQLSKRNRLFELGSMHAVQQQATPESITAEFDAAEKEFRRLHVKYMEKQMEASADFLDHYTKSSRTSTEARNTIPQMSRRQQRLAAEGSAYYVEHGETPLAL